MSHPSGAARLEHQCLAREQTMAGYLSFLILSPKSTYTILSEMAALEEVLVSDLNEMSAEELRSRGWALVTVKQNWVVLMLIP
jgi:predicted amidohydrolase